MQSNELSVGQCVTLACLLEAAAPKPGNVHRGADFDDLTFADFLVSAAAIGPAMEAASTTGVGASALAAIRATRRLVPTNTNLGMVLLLAPLAAVPRELPLINGVPEILNRLTPDDARDVYQAIREAQPGGLGQAPEMDVHDAPPPDLLTAMLAAAPRDMVARQYVEDFDMVLTQVVPWLVEGLAAGRTLTDAIVHTHVRLMSAHPDSLIARKCGLETARQAADRAARVLEEETGTEAYHEALADLDFWLRSDHHRRNPGTTADLIAAGLFAGLREGGIQPPYR